MMKIGKKNKSTSLLIMKKTLRRDWKVQKQNYKNKGEWSG